METQLKVTDQLGKLAGRPETNGLHVHPLFKSKDNIPYDDNGNTHENVYVINTEGAFSFILTESDRAYVIASLQPRRRCTKAWLKSNLPSQRILVANGTLSESGLHPLV